MFNPPIKTLRDLGWGNLLEQLAGRATGDEAADLCRSLPFLEEERAWANMNMVGELLAGIDKDDPPPSLPAHPVGETLARIRGKGAVAGEALLAISTNLKLFVSLARYLENRADACPLNLQAVLPPQREIPIVTLARLAAEIDASFEPDGSISDTASPELSKLRKRLVSLRANLLSALEAVADKEADIIRDRTVTLRNDRYVLPFRADSHRKIPGIVHGSSGTGATLFIEPASVVEAGNELMLTKESVAREEARILGELRDAVGDEIGPVSYACAAIVETEVRIAAARLAWDLDAAVPSRGKHGLMNLVEARHPLLTLEGTKVIAGTYRVEAGQTILISGPNAGGKTVVLKTVGLLALMAHGGLPIPADPESSVYLPPGILTDIGDDQSLALNLSTYSAHMTNIARILNEAQDGSIILLDELAAGTDPTEGTALGEAVLARLNRRGAATLATTHFDTLKSRAHEQEGFTNAAMGFDALSGTPTFQLHRGVPGSSSALAIARRFGIPGDVVEEAQRLLPQTARAMSQAVDALNEETRQLKAQRTEMQDTVRALKAQREEVAARLKQLKSTQDKFVDKESEALWSAIRNAREKVRDAEASIRRRRTDPATVKAAREEINEIAQKLGTGKDLNPKALADLPGNPAMPDDLKVGVKVLVISMGAQGTVDSPLKGNTVHVTVGAVRLRVGIEDLRVLSGTKGGVVPRGQKNVYARIPDAAPAHDPIRTDSNTLDLRGKAVDEALDATDSYLDGALKEGTDVVFVLHGHGTGALRDAVRTYLAESSYVERHRPGEREEGGDGITVVWLR